MFPPEASNPIAAGHEKCNIAEAYVKDFKMAIMNMLKKFKDDKINPLMSSVKTQIME